MEPVFSATVLGTYAVTYYYCEICGLLKTEKPYWLDEAYREAATDTDTGLVARNIGNSALLAVILEGLSVEKGKFLDLGGGYGLLTRLMRDRGFDCYTTDRYCQNLFAKTFEPDAHFSADVLFAFEVLEHIEDPLRFLTDAFERYGCKTIIFSTLTFSLPIPSTDWWYYSFEGGQHITFYQPRTLGCLARRLGCNYHMLTADHHIITDIDIPGIARLVLSNAHLRRLYSIYVGRKRNALSKTWDDHLRMKERLRSG
ncbi:MAG: methyltransferase domain-containing protein [Acidobacteria bacterium]|nr:methyltransferase domain-containing protein [Acidobacteriota bacterium]